jgi:hypothetical protein
MAGCGSRRYEKISGDKIEIMLNELVSRGFIITGRNPWAVDTRQHGMLLKGEWDETVSTLTITVLHIGWYVPCDAVWNTIDSLINPYRDTGEELETA